MGGCDGIWERCTSQKVTDFLMTQLAAPWDGRPRFSTACANFLDNNISQNPLQTQGLGCDNMTLLLVDLLSGASSEDSSINGTTAPAVKKRKAPPAAHVVEEDDAPAVEKRRGEAAKCSASAAAPAAKPAAAAGGNVETMGRRKRRKGPSRAWQSVSQRRRLTLTIAGALRSESFEAPSERWMAAAGESVSEALAMI